MTERRLISFLVHSSAFNFCFGSRSPLGCLSTILSSNFTNLYSVNGMSSITSQKEPLPIMFPMRCLQVIVSSEGMPLHSSLMFSLESLSEQEKVLVLVVACVIGKEIDFKIYMSATRVEKWQGFQGIKVIDNAIFNVLRNFNDC